MKNNYYNPNISRKEKIELIKKLTSGELKPEELNGEEVFHITMNIGSSASDREEFKRMANENRDKNHYYITLNLD